MKQYLFIFFLFLPAFAFAQKNTEPNNRHSLWKSPEITTQFYMFSISGAIARISHIKNSDKEITLHPLLLLGGTVSPVARFRENDSESRNLVPIELSVSPLYNDWFSVSANTVFSILNEDDKYTSLHLSFGSSVFLHNTRRLNFLPMTGWFVSVYPIYELPVIAQGRTAYYDWRTALDFGHSFLGGGLLQMTVYTRGIFAFRDGNISFFPDFGIAFGARAGMRVFNYMRRANLR